MKKQLNEIKRMQQLAGLLKENTFTPENIKQYLLGMVEEFSAGNDNEYPVGKKMEFKYESIEKEDIDNYGEEEVNTFKKAKEFLVKNGPVTINNRIDYTFSTKGKDIVMNWVEPNWDQLNENLEQAEENEIEVAFQVSPKMVPWNTVAKTTIEEDITKPVPSDVKALSNVQKTATAVSNKAKAINSIQEFPGAFENWFQTLGFQPGKISKSILRAEVEKVLVKLGYK